MARSPVKRFFGTLFFLLAVLVTLGVLVLLYAVAINDKTFPLVGEVETVYNVALIILGVLIILLLLLLAVRRYDRRGALSDDAEAFFIPETDRDALNRARADEFAKEFADSTTYAQGPDIVVYNLPLVPLMGRAWDEAPKRSKRKPQPITFTYYYPRSVERAIYVNEYIEIGKGDKVKLRILLAGPKDADKKEFDTAHTIKKVPKKKKDEPKAPAPSAPGAESPAPAVPADTSVNPFATEAPGTQATASAEAASSVTAMSGRDQTQLLLGRTGGQGASGGDFLAEIEARIDKSRTVVASTPEVFYDYPGDDHAVIDLEGIGKTYADKLGGIGVRTTGRLLYEDPQRIADAAQVPRKTVETWKSMAELIKIKGVGKQYAEAMARAGIEGIQELKRRSATVIAEQVNAYLDSMSVTITGGKVTPKRVEGWQDAAKDMRRVRMKVPAE